MKTSNKKNPENGVKTVTDPHPGKNDLHEILELKYRRRRIQKRNSALFLNIGFCLSLLFVLSAFEYRFTDKQKQIDIGNPDDNDFVLTEVPSTVIPRPPAPKNVSPQIIEITDEPDIPDDPLHIDINATEETVIDSVITVVTPPPADEEAEEPFVHAEIQPEPVGGFKAFYSFVSENLRYPAAAERLGIEGKVFMLFVVEKDGSLTDIKVLKGIGGGCDEEAVRVIKEAPKWKPGKQRGNPVRVLMSVPITFRLEQ